MAVPVLETITEQNFSGNDTTFDVSVPSGVAIDDIILIVIALDGNAGAPTSANFANLLTTSEGSVEIHVLWKRATGSDSGVYTVNWTGKEDGRFVVIRVSGCIASGDPWDVIAAGVTNAGSTTNAATEPTSTVIDTLMLGFCAVDRDRVDSGDIPSGWTEIGTSGSSGGANGAGLIAGEIDQASIGTPTALTFQTWASDGNASRCFNLKPPAGALNLERTATQTITESDAVARIKGGVRAPAQTLTESDAVAKIKGAVRTFDQALTESDVVDRGESTFERTGTTVLTHSEAIDRGGSTFERIGTTVLVHSSAIVTVLGKIRTATTVLVHSESVVKISEQLRVVAQNLTHSSVAIKISELSRTAATALVHSEVVLRILGKARTAAQTIIHSSVVNRGASTFQRVASATLTHSEVVIREGSTFVRAIADALVHSSSVVVLKTGGAFERFVAQLLTHSESVDVVGGVPGGPVIQPHVKGGLEFTQHKKWVYPLYSTIWSKVVVHVHVKDKKDSIAGILGSIYADSGFVNIKIHQKIKSTIQKAINVFGKAVSVKQTKSTIVYDVAAIKKSDTKLGEHVADGVENKVSLEGIVEDKSKNKTKIGIKVKSKSTKDVTVLRIDDILGALDG